MNLKQLFSINASKPILVCETDGFSLSAAVLRQEAGELKLIHKAEVDQVDMAEALEECVTQLKQDGWQGGGKAILLSPAVLSTLVELPVSPKKTRPLQQMMALVRGEVEILLMQYMMRWSVGHLLVGRGYLTETQAQAVMDLQQGKPNPAGGLELLDKFSFKRFGELAEELGYIKRSQLTACLTGQEWLKADDELIECNWVAQGMVEDIPGTYNWLVSCVSGSLLQRWVSVFNKQGIQLTALYPLTGCSAVLLPEQNDNQVVLESHHGQALAIKTQETIISAQQNYIQVDKSALARCLESYHALPSSHHDTVYLCSWEDEIEGLADALQYSLDRDIQQLTHPAMSMSVSVGMLGAASHALRLGKNTLCTAVLEGGPIPPWTERLEIRAALVTALIVFCMLTTELILFIRYDQAYQQQQILQVQWDSLDEARKRITAEAREINKHKQALKKQRDEQIRLKAMLDFYNHAIPARVALIEDLLAALQTTVNDEVIILSLREKNLQPKALNIPFNIKKSTSDKAMETESFIVEAWALSEAAAQTFIQNMQRAVAPSGLEVRDTPVLTAKGPLNLDGFDLKMRLVKTLSLAALSPVVQHP